GRRGAGGRAHSDGDGGRVDTDGAVGVGCRRPAPLIARSVAWTGGGAARGVRRWTCMNDDTATDVTGVSPSAGHTTGPAARTPRQHDPSIGELQLEERSSLRRVGGLSTELQDINDAEYRALRLERVVLVGVWTEGSAARADAAMAGLAQLAETAGSEGCDALIQRRDKPDAATYVGSGRAAELKDVIAATGAGTTAGNAARSDGTALILDIFAQRATSREGKAPVSLAQMEYRLPRLRGWGEASSRQAGGRAGRNGGGGLRGPGETKIETDRR